MLLTVVVTLWHSEVVEYQWILVGVLIGSVVGALVASRLQLTEMPELVALFNGFGVQPVCWSAREAYHRQPVPDAFGAATIVLAVVIGSVAFTGSLVAWAKLKEIGWKSFRVSKPLLSRDNGWATSCCWCLSAPAASSFALIPRKDTSCSSV